MCRLALNQKVLEMDQLQAELSTACQVRVRVSFRPLQAELPAVCWNSPHFPAYHVLTDTTDDHPQLSLPPSRALLGWMPVLTTHATQANELVDTVSINFQL